MVVASAAVPLFVLVAPLLRRMRGDLLELGALRNSTAAAMWACYAIFGGLEAAALRCRPVGPSGGRRGVVAGGVLAGAGAAFGVAGMSRFQTPGQLQGTEEGDLVTGGLYGVSRDPQYAGMVAALAGLALLRRPPSGASLAAGLAVTLNAWVKTEELHLVQHFGEPYRRYQAEVHRWVGRRSAART